MNLPGNERNTIIAVNSTISLRRTNSVDVSSISGNGAIFLMSFVSRKCTLGCLSAS